MALFNAPGWLLKQKKSSPASVSGNGQTEDDFLKNKNTFGMKISGGDGHSKPIFERNTLAFRINIIMVGSHFPKTIEKLNVYFKYKKSNGEWTGHIKSQQEINMKKINQIQTIKLNREAVSKEILDMLTKKHDDGGTSDIYVSFSSDLWVALDTNDLNPDVTIGGDPDFHCDIDPH